jgi:hypothetical protein
MRRRLRVHVLMDLDDIALGGRGRLRTGSEDDASPRVS